MPGTTQNIEDLPGNARLLMKELEAVLGCRLGNPIGTMPAEILPTVPFQAFFHLPNFPLLHDGRIELTASFHPTQSAARVHIIMLHLRGNLAQEKGFTHLYEIIQSICGPQNGHGHAMDICLDQQEIFQLKAFNRLANLRDKVRAACDT